MGNEELRIKNGTVYPLSLRIYYRLFIMLRVTRRRFFTCKSE
jgi:hypothetical protein